jgi:phage gp29-like protein
LAEDIEEKDGHIYAELFKRKMCLSNTDFEVRPPSNASAREKKDADNIEQMLRDIEDWNDIIFNMSDAILKGFSNTEYEWMHYNNWRIPHKFEHRPATWFQLHQDDQSSVVLRDHTGKGEYLRPFNWIQHKHAAKSGYPARQGLVRQLAWPFIFKNYSVRDLAEFLEIYGIPIRIGKYPGGATSDEKARLLQAVMSVGHNAGGIIPKGMELDFHDAAKGGGSDPFMTMMSWCERTQSKAILGQTLTAEAGNIGSQALGNVHNGVRKEISVHDLGQLAGTLNRDLIMPLHMLNGKSYTGDPRRKPRLLFDTQELGDIELWSRAVGPLVANGVVIPASHVQNELKIPQRKGEEPILAPVSAAPALPDSNETGANNSSKATAALKADIATLRNRPESPTDGAEVFTQKLLSGADVPFNPLLTPIEELVNGATSLEDLQEQLLELEGQLPLEQYTEYLALAFAAAELSGRFDVNEGE